MIQRKKKSSPFLCSIAPPLLVKQDSPSNPNNENTITNPQTINLLVVYLEKKLDKMKKIPSLCTSATQQFALVVVVRSDGLCP